MPYQLTSEQSEIVRTDLKPGEILKIIAFAGTGKTSTLFEYTKERPELRFLYVAFNKSVQIEASAKFPNNVRCKTAHSLAWPGFGVKFRERLVPDIKAYMVRETLNLSNNNATINQATDAKLNQAIDSHEDQHNTPQKKAYPAWR
jgi:F-box protein 18 (helicase)